MSRAAAASAKWCGLDAPMIGALTTGFARTHASATVAMDTPRAWATDCTSSMISRFDSSSTKRRPVCGVGLRPSGLLTQGRVSRPRQRAPWDASDALICEQAEHLPFLFTHEEVVLVLHGHEPRPPVQISGVLQLGELPGQHRGGADVAHLARLDDVVEGLHRLLGGRLVVKSVDLVEVHVVRTEPGQGRVDLLHDRLAGRSGSPWTGVHGVALVASTMSSRRVYFLIARPTISSERPQLLTVGKAPRVMPRSTACRNRAPIPPR
ncbi:hypothetical protein SVIOM74S_09544 [Streptomyces violarus]